MLGFLALAASARAEPAPGAEPTTPAELLTAAGEAVDGDKLDRAAQLYERIVRDHPDSPEAREAQRALKLLAARRAPAAAPAPPAALPVPRAAAEAPAATNGVVLRQEPYSLRTSERLRLSTWEKLDFGTTAFLYGLSVGFAYSIAQDENQDGSAVVPPMVVGALAYTLGAVAYLGTARPDRGDLPLALGVASYVPTTAILAANAASNNVDPQTGALLFAVSGTLAVPAALLATWKLDLDPGDAQLVRDAGFWGLVLATTGALGFAGSKPDDPFTGYRQPSGRAVSMAGLVGLYGGLTLGAVAATSSEVSLERVRVSTWGGYGGGLLGALIGAAQNGNESHVFRGLSVGALLGLVVTFVTTGALDGIPPETTLVGKAARARWSPTPAPIVALDGRLTLGWGLRLGLP